METLVIHWLVLAASARSVELQGSGHPGLYCLGLPWTSAREGDGEQVVEKGESSSRILV